MTVRGPHAMSVLALVTSSKRGQDTHFYSLQAVLSAKSDRLRQKCRISFVCSVLHIYIRHKCSCYQKPVFRYPVLSVFRCPVLVVATDVWVTCYFLKRHVGQYTCHLLYEREEYLENYFIQYSFCPIINWPCHGSGDQSPAMAVPSLRLSVAGAGRAVAQAIIRRHWSCHDSGGCSPPTNHGGPESIQGRSMWDSWWTEWHWDWVLTEYFGFSLSAQCISTSAPVSPWQHHTYRALTLYQLGN